MKKNNTVEKIIMERDTDQVLSVSAAVSLAATCFSRSPQVERAYQVCTVC
jgi:hypothetical protein